MLYIKNLSKSYQISPGVSREVLCIDSFQIKASEKVVIYGESGSGKSTLLNLVCGVIRPDSGSLKFEEIDLSQYSEAQYDEFRAQKLGIVFQNFHLLQGYTALENVSLPSLFAGFDHQERAKELLYRVGLKGRIHDYPNSLSVGQQQRVALARALINQPALILADEPTASLDPKNRDEALDLMFSLCDENGSAIMMVTHQENLKTRFDREVDLCSINQAVKEKE